VLALNQPPPASWATRASWDTVECRGVEPRERCLQSDAVHQHPPRGLASQRAASNRLPPLYESGAPPVVLRWRSRRRGLNPLPHAYKARAHPVVLHRRRWCPRRDSNAHRRRSRRRASASWATRADRAGNGGFEPPRAGSEPAMLPVTSAPKGGPAVGSRRHRFSAGRSRLARTTLVPSAGTAAPCPPRRGCCHPCALCRRAGRDGVGPGVLFTSFAGPVFVMWSGYGESNPGLLHGKQPHYRCATAAGSRRPGSNWPPRPYRERALPHELRRRGTSGGIRTRTVPGLSRAPLPVGPPRRALGADDSNPHDLSQSQAACR